MAEILNVAKAPKDSTFQVRINSEIKKTVEEIYARTGTGSSSYGFKES